MPRDATSDNPQPNRKTRTVKIGDRLVGGDNPILMQSMCATHTSDVEATVWLTKLMANAGAGLVRLAVDSKKDAAALPLIREKTQGINLVIDLQENFKLAADVAPHVDKFRYNPGHLYHHQKEVSARDKVAFLVDTARKHDCAVRIGVNCGSVDPALLDKFPADDRIGPMVASAVQHCGYMDELGFERFVVSLKDSDPTLVIEANKRFAKERPDIPLHLGVTEAGLPPMGVIKTRIAYEQLIPLGIGDTVRVSLTVPNDRKNEEIEAARTILDDIHHKRFRSVPDLGGGRNIISCPSCSRVENDKFVDLAQKVDAMTAALKADLTIAVMGCRVNGPGETDHADLGLWCGPAAVNLKRGTETVGAFSYDEILPALQKQIDDLLASRVGASK
jgi:(E)-4-hydroxy-3-methylbut-2-enyl-diphosphate synthase